MTRTPTPPARPNPSRPLKARCPPKPDGAGQACSIFPLQALPSQERATSRHTPRSPAHEIQIAQAGRRPAGQLLVLALDHGPGRYRPCQWDDLRRHPRWIGLDGRVALALRRAPQRRATGALGDQQFDDHRGRDGVFGDHRRGRLRLGSIWPPTAQQLHERSRQPSHPGRLHRDLCLLPADPADDPFGRRGRRSRRLRPQPRPSGRGGPGPLLDRCPDLLYPPRAAPTAYQPRRRGRWRPPAREYRPQLSWGRRRPGSRARRRQRAAVHSRRVPRRTPAWPTPPTEP